MAFIKKYLIEVLGVLLVGLFCLLRFVNLETTMFFINDMGRDLLVLLDWQTTGKPPLLGPQTSALPINQSAIYFYMLMPAFLLTGGSPMTLFFTNAFVYCGAFLFGLWSLRKHPKLQIGLLTFFFLVIMSPQYLVQSRFIVWNPSFVTPFLGMALVAFYLLTEKFSRNRLIFFAFSLATAISISYSVAPAFIAINAYLIFFWKKNRIKTLFLEMFALFVVNLPTVLFEIKHKFVLTSTLLDRGTMPQKANDISFITKFNSLFGYGLELKSWPLVVAVILLAVIIFWYAKSKKNAELRFFAILLASTITVTFLVPLTIHTHYIFGFTTLLFLCIATLPKAPKILFLSVITAYYLFDMTKSGLFNHASRTYQQMSSCFATVCKEFKEPMFVSVQANFHPYHNGPEHRYMLKKSGCDVRYIEEPGASAHLMTVVLDDSSYQHGVTAYNELTMFGKSKEVKRFDCQYNFGAVILRKD